MLFAFSSYRCKKRSAPIGRKKKGRSQNRRTTSAMTNPQSKRKRFQWTEASMTAACAAVSNGSMSQRHAAKCHGVPRATLQKILDGKTYCGAKPGKKPVLKEQEIKLVDYAVQRASLGIGFGKKQFFDYATKLAAKHKYKFKNGKPSEKWWRLLKKRHDRMRLRRPEPTAAVRHMCMDRSKVGSYFKSLEGLLQKTALSDKPQHVWNMDETGVQLEHKPRRILAQKGTKYLHARTSGNRETITVIACVNAAGDKIPPHIIAKETTSRALHGFDLRSAPEGSTWSVSSTGWTKQGIAQLWFEKSFLPNIGKERPQILILDGHDSHNFVEFIELAQENQIEIVELPAHTSHWLQPCDRTLFKPFKDAYNNYCQELMNAFPGTVISHSNFCGLLAKAWEKAITTANAQSGFRACGIFPFNPEQIPEEAYLPNTLYATENEANTAGRSQPTETMLPEVGEQTVNCLDEVTAEDDVSLIGSIDTSHLLQMEEMDTSIANINVSFSDFDHVTTDQPNNTTTANTVGQPQPCPPDLALHAVEVSLRPEKLDQYREAYVKNMHLLNDHIYVTWKSYRDQCSMQESARPTVDDQIQPHDPTCASFETVLTNSTSLSLAAENDAMEIQAQPYDPTCSYQSSVQAHSTPRSAMQILEPISVNKLTTDEPDSDSDILVMPKPHIRKKSVRKQQDKFFILTSAEAYAAKVRQKEEKRRQKSKRNSGKKNGRN